MNHIGEIERHFEQTEALHETSLPNLSAWANLISFRPPTAIQRSLLNRSGWIDWPVHRIEDARGDINLDYYPVQVTRLPVVGGRTMSAEQLLSHIRLNINSFVDRNIAEFAPYNASEKRKWLSASPLGAVIHIDMKMWGGWVNPDDGSVVVAHYTPQNWIFSTIWTLGDGGHPVSGNRQFGFWPSDSGAYIYFTKGADRTTTAVDTMMSSKVFSAAHALWLSLQQRIAAFVNGAGGSATVQSATSRRYDWPSVKAAYHRPTTSWI